jgi:transcriptional repressor NrdR
VAACQKRNIPKERLESVVDNVIKWALKLREREIPADWIGGKVLRELKDVDPVAYVRFASVQRTYSDLDEFLKKLEPEGQVDVLEDLP